MKPAVLMLFASALAACGADGAPMRPSANVGMSVGSNGVSTSTVVGASNGTVSVGVGF